MKKNTRNITVVSTILGILVAKLIWPGLQVDSQWIVLILPTIVIALIFLKYKNPNPKKRKAQIILVLSLGLMGALVYKLLIIKDTNPTLFKLYKPLFGIIVVIAIIALIISGMYVSSLLQDDENSEASN